MRALDRLRAMSEWRARTEPVDIEDIESRIGHALPADLRELLTTCAGFEGFIGENYFWLMPIDEFVEFNGDPDTRECYPGQIIFASSGGGEYFALNTNTSPPRYAMVPAIGGPEDALDQGPTLEQLLERIERDQLFDPAPP